MRVSTQETAELRDFDPVYVGSGSKSVIRRCPLNVRITLNNGRRADIGSRPKSATTGREQMQQHAVRGRQSYSIASARSHAPPCLAHSSLGGAATTHPCARNSTPPMRRVARAPG